MKEIKIDMKLEEIPVSELSPLDRELMNRAIAAARNAYAPYSHFHVGAALMLTNGKMVTGCNQENAASPSCVCAEVAALTQAGVLYPKVPIRDIAIIALKKEEPTERIAPCGNCRQVMLEYEKRGNSPIRILLCGREKVQIITSAKSLLPLSFSADELG
ncbi:cytidine deaminase [Parabacteroides sp. PFB2-12]|uniref:cytidine deaminase n=1 Tax=unclassified Parabacteroides TaxID=2649774 RepID=UPI002474EA18|nr:MULTISPECIES: cytidine deaminase [unclassified Parabacteroides]MDH6341777.1 cytidine deaminase [Parabacteroides sp. PM6-13]MDH6389800.1 cytidine deaminase [Parabacteroides sp. PFB2-12]